MHISYACTCDNATENASMLRRITDKISQYSILFAVSTFDDDREYYGIARGSATVQNVIDFAEYVYERQARLDYLNVNGDLRQLIFVANGHAQLFRKLSNGDYEIHASTPMSKLDFEGVTDEVGRLSFHFQLGDAIGEYDMLALQQRVVTAAKTMSVHENVASVYVDEDLYIASEGATVTDMLLETDRGACELVGMAVGDDLLRVHFDKRTRSCTRVEDDMVRIGYKTPLHTIRDEELIDRGVSFHFATRKRGLLSNLQQVRADAVAVRVVFQEHARSQDTFIMSAAATLGRVTRLAQRLWRELDGAGWVALNYADDESMGERYFVFANDHDVVNTGGISGTRGLRKRVFDGLRLRELREDEHAYGYTLTREDRQAARRRRRHEQQQRALDDEDDDDDDDDDEGKYEDNGFRPDADLAPPPPRVIDILPYTEPTPEDMEAIYESLKIVVTANTPLTALLEKQALDELGRVQLVFTVGHEVPPTYMEADTDESSEDADIRYASNDTMLVAINDNVYATTDTAKVKVKDVLDIAKRAGCEIAGVKRINAGVDRVCFVSKEKGCRWLRSSNGTQCLCIGFNTPLSLLFEDFIYDDSGRLSFVYYLRTDADEAEETKDGDDDSDDDSVNDNDDDDE